MMTESLEARLAENREARGLLALAGVKTGAWLEDQEFAPLQWFVEGVVPEGYGLLTGPPKIGKSWLVLDLALAIASGGQALGSIKCQQRPVLYLALEDSDRRMQDRARKLMVAEDTFTEKVPDSFSYCTDVHHSNVFPLIDAWLDEIPDGIVFLDTLGKVMPPQMNGESAYQRDYRIGGDLKALVARHAGSGVVVVHHTKKGAEDDWMNSTSGTNGLNGAADYTVNLARDRGSDEGVLRGTGRDSEDFELAMDFDSGQWKLFGGDVALATAHASEAIALLGIGDKSKDLLRVVADHPDGISPTDASIALADRISRNDAGTYLRRLAATGRVRKVGRGKYAPITDDTAEILGDDNKEI